MTVTLWHNPSCSTSRRVLADLRAAGIEPRLVDYPREGWTAPGLTALLAAAGLTPRAALRAKEPLARDLGLAQADDPAILAAMLAHPLLVERPFVQTPKGTRLCRPPERLLEIL